MKRSIILNILQRVKYNQIDLINAELMLLNAFYETNNNSMNPETVKNDTADMFL